MLRQEDDATLFVDARLADFDNDGKLEVVSEPFTQIPDDLLPSDYVQGDRDLGRYRLVWKWSDSIDRFKLIHREFLYIGGR